MQDDGRGVFSGRSTLYQEACHPLHWREVGVEDAGGSGVLEAVGGAFRCSRSCVG
jgi:hypothetical protein